MIQTFEILRMGNKEKERKNDESKDIKTFFDHFAKFEDQDGGRAITLNNIDKWMVHAELTDKCGISEQDTADTFLDITKDKERLNFSEFQGFLTILASKKKMDVQELYKYLMAEDLPQTNGFIPPIMDIHAAHMNNNGSSAECDCDFLYNLQKKDAE
ncbi:hypothetical protein NPIL_565791 [Nephila pilipes]|uniref:EF-hand domain-containing protein n=1 Tax=Nephila pilipes TaxID=299642 RepID=A0A8X6U021_NEPPI|nr:hypothetical protein NPIL_565791 [Nephila pilipes]